MTHIVSSPILQLSIVSSAMTHIYSTLNFKFPNNIPRHTTFSQHTKVFTITTSASFNYSTNTSRVLSNTSSWQWKFKDNSIKIHYEEHGGDESDEHIPSKNILMLPTISDVSTVEEWRLVAKEIVQRPGNVNWRAIIVDWPGLGYSDRPKLKYNADVMESFLVDFILDQTSPISRLGWMMYKILVSNKKFMRSHYKSHVYADSTNVTQAIIDSRHELTKQKDARYGPTAFLTGLLDPVKTREEFLKLFQGLEGKVPILVVWTSSARKRSKTEMEALREAKGVSKFVEVKGALLPHEEYPSLVATELYSFLQDVIA